MTARPPAQPTPPHGATPRPWGAVPPTSSGTPARRPWGLGVVVLLGLCLFQPVPWFLVSRTQSSATDCTPSDFLCLSPRDETVVLGFISSGITGVAALVLGVALTWWLSQRLDQRLAGVLAFVASFIGGWAVTLALLALSGEMKFG